jgi:hypothetical protein
MMHRQWFTVVAGIVVAMLVGGSARAADISPQEVKNVCAKVTAPGCQGKNPDLEAFCGLVSVVPIPGSAWDTAKVPTVAQLRGASCGPAALAMPALASPLASPNSTGSASLDQSTFIWGATQFLLNRASTELQDWALDKFVSLICDDGAYAKLGGQPVFANTCPVLKTLSLDGFLGGLSSVESAMKVDFAHLPVLVVNYAAVTTTLNAGQKDALGVAMLISKIVEANLTGSTGIASLPAALKIKPPQSISCASAPATADAWELMSLIASFPQDSAKKVQLPGDTDSWRYAVMSFGINAGDASTDWGKGWPSDCRNGTAFAFHPTVLFAGTQEVIAAAAAIDAALKQLGQVPVGADPSIKLELYAEIVAATLDPFSKVLAADGAVNAEAGPVGTGVQDAERIAADLAGGSYGNVTVDLLHTIVDFGGSGDWVNTVARLASFGSDVAQATTSDQVAAAINHAAAPVGSYKRKRIGDWYADVNAYVGLSLGEEYGKGPDDRWSDGTWAFTPGFWVPVGFEFGHGQVFGKNAVGLLLQAVDLGALASWRVQTNSTDQLAAPPNVTFAQVVSPGAALVWGVDSSPLTLSFHGEFSPSLRKVGQTDAARDAARIGLDLAIDIPLFP